jgi:hypothetical protein
VYLHSAREKLKELAKTSQEQGNGEEFHSLVLELDQQLRSNPDALGEPFYTLKRAALQIRTGNVRQLFALYAIDARRRIVYVRDFVLLKGSLSLGPNVTSAGTDGRVPGDSRAATWGGHADSGEYRVRAHTPDFRSDGLQAAAGTSQPKLRLKVRSLRMWSTTAILDDVE